jgi:hypothetical protein
MAKAKPAGATTPDVGATTDPNAVAGTDTAATTPARVKRDPENELHWNEARMIVLAGLLAQSPGLLTADSIAKTLSGHPAFADQATLLQNGAKIAEKIRSQVKKLNAKAVKRGFPELKLKHGSGGGRTNMDSVFTAVFGAATATAQAPTQIPAPVTAPQPIPIVQQPVGGGLISIPG